MPSLRFQEHASTIPEKKEDSFEGCRSIAVGTDPCYWIPGGRTMVEGQCPNIIVNESRHEESCHDGDPSREDFCTGKKTPLLRLSWMMEFHLRPQKSSVAELVAM
jgi:hypothetical protein